MHPQTYSLPAVFVDTSGEQLQRICKPPKGYVSHGCAIREPHVCYVYVEPNAPKWLAAHELYHCAGFNHDAP